MVWCWKNHDYRYSLFSTVLEGEIQMCRNHKSINNYQLRNRTKQKFSITSESWTHIFVIIYFISLYIELGVKFWTALNWTQNWKSCHKNVIRLWTQVNPTHNATSCSTVGDNTIWIECISLAEPSYFKMQRFASQFSAVVCRSQWRWQRWSAHAICWFDILWYWNCESTSWSTAFPSDKSIFASETRRKHHSTCQRITPWHWPQSALC